MHHIQKHILRVLIHTKWACFSDMQPPNIDSNAYSYHLKALCREKLVEKLPKGYRLSPIGLAYVDRISMEKLETRLQPKIITMQLIHNDTGAYLLWSKQKQPFITSWSLPHGKVHLTDQSLRAAAEREVAEKIHMLPTTLSHVGDCYVRALISGELVSYVLAHIFIVTLSSYDEVPPDMMWANTEQRRQLQLSPATEEIINVAETSSGRFFEEFAVDW